MRRPDRADPGAGRVLAIRAGADPGRVRITTVTDVPMTSMPGNCARVIVTAGGPLVVLG